MLIERFLLPGFFFLLCAYAQVLPDKYGYNITVAFFPESEESTCQEHNIANAIAFTTGNIPAYHTCFNLQELFIQRSNYTYQDTWSFPPSQSINYTVGNVPFYSPNTNYNRIWYHLGGPNQVPKGVPKDAGGWSEWTLMTYNFPNCTSANSTQGATDQPKDNVPFRASCRTTDAGICSVAPKPIKSFAIYHSPIGQKGLECTKWAKFTSGATTLNRQPSIVPLFAVAAFLAM
ncbi:hypothetical protein ONS95_000725 [Cadophora gregata]|uniref:uncharacterized protein n=1 Tax=Cadophora gregata TaxID=51156 RepID=UPI0026DD7895|nr:uncharacterized protein ONS95_000725 [Cadophora gregata]KAK0103099.1 hypothetical protein ONS96_005708 [Cadophora gregata f. sp. sojae]KAK0128774.1 hypothetical protein ONS95_000725 [Cadophora gregata]